MILCGNHSNQFIDPMLILNNCPRKLSFLMAASVYYIQSLKKKIVGFFGRCFGVIPVKRPQDYVIKGEGLINVQDMSSKVTGTKTKFTVQVSSGDSLKFEDDTYLIKEVISDTELELASPAKGTKDMQFNIIPKLDQTEVYTSVHEALRRRECIGIFPEGGSHDRTTLLPLKAGICLMALGAMSKYNISVTIQCVGLNYYSGHKFRSKAVVNFGVPYKVPQDLATLYLQDRRKAVKKLLNIVESRMKEVWVTAPSYEELTYIFTARRVYKPDEVRKDSERDIELNRMFSKGYRYLNEKYPNLPALKETAEAISKYNSHLKKFGVKDYQLRNRQVTKGKLILYSVYSLIAIILELIFILPGMIFTGIIGVIIRNMVETERKKALAGSNVKLYGRDVMASFKIVYGIMLLPIGIGVLMLVIFVSSLCKR